MSYQLHMAAQVRAWLSDLRVSDPPRARLVGEAVTALLGEGPRLAPPLVVAAESGLLAHDPRDALDYSYQRQLELLTRVRRGVADVATSRRRLELQIGQLEAQARKLEAQGGKAAEAGRDDLAQEARARRSAVQDQLGDLRRQYAGLQNEEEKLTLASQRLQAKVDAFRTRKEAVKAAYTAGQAGNTVDEAFADLGEDSGRAEVPDDAGDAVAAAGSAAGELLDTAREVEQEARQAAGEGLQGRDPLPSGLNELRIDGPEGQDVRILFAFAWPSTVALLEAGDCQGGWRAWHDEALPRARDLPHRQGEGPGTAFSSYDKDAFLSEFFPGEAPELASGAARLIARNRVHRLIEIRRRAGLTQAQVAARMNVPPERVSAIERGEPAATEVGTLAAYVEALGGRLIVDLGAERVVLGY
jgi:phage shock protein A/DNA-binding XRE family transcriptional regulator